MVSKIKSYVEFVCKINRTDGSFVGYGERRCKILSLNLLSSPDSSGKKCTKPPALPVIVGISKFIHGKVVRRMKVLRKTRGSGLSGGHTQPLCSLEATLGVCHRNVLSIFLQKEALE